MAKFQTAKDILTSHNFLDSRAKAQKYVKHEFQDYAYRLAVDLGDLKHRALYMKLAKSVDRTTLEQAAAFAMDYDKEKNKGKIFMWRLAQLRAATQLKQDMRNLEHGFVLRKMAKLFDQTSFSLSNKQKSQLETKQKLAIEVFHLLPEGVRNAKKLPQVLLALGGSGLESKIWKGVGAKVSGLGISRALVDTAKKSNPESKFIRKSSLLEHKFKARMFDIVWLGRMWELVPFADEQKYIRELKKLLKPGGILFIEAYLAESESEQWREFMLKDNPTIYFQKLNTAVALETRLATHGFELVTRGTLEDKRTGYVWKLASVK